MLKKFLKGEKGFTLVELLIVVAIIGILAGVAIPNFMGARTKAQVARAFADMDAIAKAEEMYAIDNEVYTETLTSTYIQTVPDDPWGGSYDIVLSASSTMYVILCASGPSRNGTIVGDSLEWGNDQRKRGTLGGSGGPDSAYDIAKNDDGSNDNSLWYNPGEGARSAGSIGYGGG